MSGDNATTAQPTQVTNPARAVLRTVVQVGIPVVLALGVVVPEIVRVILEELDRGAVEPPSWLRGALLTVAAAVTIAAAILTRVMAIPAVNAWLRTVRLDAGYVGEHRGSRG